MVRLKALDICLGLLFANIIGPRDYVSLGTVPEQPVQQSITVNLKTVCAFCDAIREDRECIEQHSLPVFLFLVIVRSLSQPISIQKPRL